MLNGKLFDVKKNICKKYSIKESEKKENILLEIKPLVFKQFYLHFVLKLNGSSALLIDADVFKISWNSKNSGTEKIEAIFIIAFLIYLK